MGSSGSGRISDYPGSSTGNSGSGGGGRKPPEDRCARAFNAQLEDVEQSEYYKSHSSAPPIKTQLKLEQRKRLVAVTEYGESVGNLPTSLNYLAACIKDGWAYIGAVESVKKGPPLIKVFADFVATSPK